MNLSEEAIQEISHLLMDEHAVYFHIGTTEIISIPEFRDDYVPRDHDEAHNQVAAEPDAYLKISPMGDDEAYQIMREFAGKHVNDSRLQARLYRTLDQRRPFANFKHIVFDSDFREEWDGYLNGKNKEFTHRSLVEKLAEMGIEVNMASREVILYVACSLDGFIARADGALDWLPTPPEGEDFGYASFLEGIGVTLMGNKTFQQVLSFEGEFPYMELENYIFSRSPGEIPEGIPAEFITGDPIEFVRELRAKSGPDIWLIGGGEVNALLLREGLIDRLKLFYIPVALGSGIPLFGNESLHADFRLVETRTYPGGTLEAEYKIRREVPTPESEEEEADTESEMEGREE